MIVPFSDTGTHPGAVVVEVLHTVTTEIAVDCPRGADNTAS